MIVKISKLYCYSNPVKSKERNYIDLCIALGQSLSFIGQSSPRAPLAGLLPAAEAVGGEGAAVRCTHS